MRLFLTLLTMAFTFTAFGQTPLRDISDRDIQQHPRDAFTFDLDLAGVRAKLAAVPRSDSEQAWVRMRIPLADGMYREVEVAEAPVVAPKIYNRYPENRSYKIRGVEDPYLSGRMAITNKGLSALLYTKSSHVYIEPMEGKLHKAYERDIAVMQNFSCGTDHTNHKTSPPSMKRTSVGTTERKYTMAIACTGEFSNERGNNLSTINGDIMTFLTLLNTIYERDLAITFELTADNDDIIFFNPATDGLTPGSSSAQLSSAQSVIGSTIGSANYDIGHVFHELNFSGGGWTGSGVASLGVVCNSSFKARGWSGCGGNYPNDFWMGIFAHEVGHQFDATHTFYGTTGNCAGSQRSVGNGVEPGSGNSLMSYEGTCGASGGCPSQNITPQSDFLYFHGHSIDQIQNFVSSSGSCFNSTSTGNSPPVISMPPSYTIPKETPFFLAASATDADGDPLWYSWEEVDTDNLSLSCPNGEPDDAATSTTAPLFRSFDPSPDGDLRYFPKLSDVLAGTQTMGEILPEVGRSIDMRFTVRGTGGTGITGVSYEDVTLTVAGNAGPFEVTTANTPTAFLAGETTNITWSVNNTNLAPVSCSNVNILFSNDGGDSFPITLASNVPNSGSRSVTMPSNATEEGRIKVEAVNNVFFSINKGDITIISDCAPNSSSIVNDGDVTADAGDPSLNLDLVIGETFDNVSGSIEDADPNTNLIGRNNSTGSCTAFTNFPGYDTYLLTATATDVYTFNISSSGFSLVLNFYQDEFVPPATGCQNWITSNFSFNPIIVADPFSISLSEGDVIELVASGFSTSNSGSYSINVTSGSGGELIEGAAVPTGYVYRFVIYNSAGTIIGIEADADLSDDTQYAGDVYTVRGLMVLETVNLNTYINQSFASLQNDLSSGSVCGELSSNDVTVTINGCTAGTKFVTSGLDNGAAGTLRFLTENACPGDVIVFDPSLAGNTIQLNSEINIAENVSITGLGMNSLSISGNNSNRIFNINAGVSLNVSDLALINGQSATNGGAFLNNGTIQLGNVRLEGNREGATPKAFTNLNTLTMANSVEVLD